MLTKQWFGRWKRSEWSNQPCKKPVTSLRSMLQETSNMTPWYTMYYHHCIHQRETSLKCASKKFPAVSGSDVGFRWDHGFLSGKLMMSCRRRAAPCSLGRVWIPEGQPGCWLSCQSLAFFVCYSVTYFAATHDLIDSWLLAFRDHNGHAMDSNFALWRHWGSPSQYHQYPRWTKKVLCVTDRWLLVWLVMPSTSFWSNCTSNIM